MKKILKLLNIDVTSVDEENRQIKFCFSDNQPDRMDEVVDQGSWDVKNYLANPIILWGHDPSNPENVLGTSVELELDVNGKSYVTAQFDDEDTNPKAALVFRQLVKRTLRTLSAGFIPHTVDTVDDRVHLKDNELLEISVVPIPANPRAVMLSYKAGEISQKDATWMIDSMRKEADLIEKQVKEAKQPKEKSMSPEQAQALIDGIANLTAKVEEQGAEIAELRAAQPPVETDEEKLAREGKEKEEADAAEAKRIEDEKAAAEAAGNQDPAKSGGNDQGGAGGDEFDEDAELTPEQLAELDAAFDLEPAA